MPPHTHTHTAQTVVETFSFLSSCPVVAMAMPTSPWLVNDLGEPVCAVVAPPPYSYDPSGSDLPRGQSSHGGQQFLVVGVLTPSLFRRLQGSPVLLQPGRPGRAPSPSHIQV